MNSLDLSQMSAQELLDKIAEDAYNKKSLTGSDGILTQLVKRAYEAALAGEMDAHLAETKLEESNRRNGKNSKTVKSSYGPF